MVAAQEMAPGAERPLALGAPTASSPAPGGLGELRRPGALRRRRPGAGAGADYPLPAWSRRPAAAARWRCCRTGRWPGATGRPGCSRRWHRCSTGSATTAASGCGRASGEAEAWLSAYAMEFLLRARKRRRRRARPAVADGAEVPRRSRPTTASDTPEDLAAQAYRLLRAGAGRARRGRGRRGAAPSSSTSCRRRWPARSSGRRWRWRTTSRAPRRRSPRRWPRRRGSWWCTTTAPRCATRRRWRCC